MIPEISQISGKRQNPKPGRKQDGSEKRLMKRFTYCSIGLTALTVYYSSACCQHSIFASFNNPVWACLESFCRSSTYLAGFPPYWFMVHSHRCSFSGSPPSHFSNNFPTLLGFAAGEGRLRSLICINYVSVRYYDRGF